MEFHFRKKNHPDKEYLHYIGKCDNATRRAKLGTIAANYHFTSQGRLKLRHTIAVSVFNAYGRDNVEMQSFVIDSDTGRYRMKQNKSIYKYMPSISYAVEF